MNDDALIAAALDAQTRAYAPYSKFPVGAAIETMDGQVFTGCNVENVTFGLTRCAEQVAIAKAVSEGHRTFRRIAIAANAPKPAMPCGLCRQMMAEFCEDLDVVSVTAAGDQRRSRLSELLPGAFRPSDLLGER